MTLVTYYLCKCNSDALQKSCIFTIGKNTDKEFGWRLTPMDYEYKHQAKGEVCRMDERLNKVKQLVLLSRKASVCKEDMLLKQVKQVVLHEENGMTLNNSTS